MLRIYAPHYVRIGQMIEKYRIASVFSTPDDVPNQKQLTDFLETLQSLRRLCSEIQLQVSTRTLDRTLAELANGVPRQNIAQQRMNEWFSCFTSELENRLFMLILPHRVGYWHANVWDGESFFGQEIGTLLNSLEDGFKGAFYDATEAGQCFAYGLFTACVYHFTSVRLKVEQIQLVAGIA